MNRKEFLDRLTKKLKENEVKDIEEIVSEYEEHFKYKLIDGYSEEEIAAKLGNPEALALQFVTGNEEKKPKCSKALTVTGLVFLDIFVGMFYILLFASVAALAVLSIAAGVLGLCMIVNYNPYSLLPPVPYWCGSVMAVSFIALAVLTAVGCVYFSSFVSQIMRTYGRYCQNLIASASGKPVLPSVASYPRLSARTNRRLRKTALTSLTVFIICFVAGFVVCSISAGSFGFWHVWKWFI